MNKEVLLALIEKDVTELQALLPAVAEMESVPERYLQLLLTKAEAIVDNTKSLSPNLRAEKSMAEQDAINAAMRDIIDDYIHHKKVDFDQLNEKIDLLTKENELLKVQQGSENSSLEQVKTQVESLAKQGVELQSQRDMLLASVAAKDLEISSLQEKIASLEDMNSRLVNQLNSVKVVDEPVQKEEQKPVEEKREEVKETPQEDAPSEKKEEQINDEPAKEDAVIPEAAVTTVADSISHQKTVFDKIRDNNTQTVVSQMNNNKIEDLRSAISIADRFRFQRELFANNGEQMNIAIEKFNSFTTFEQAQDYIDSMFQWNDESKIVIEFKELLRRRYL